MKKIHLYFVTFLLSVIILRCPSVFVRQHISDFYLKVHSCAQTWYLSILKCDSRVVVHSSIWTLCIPKCAYGAHKTCFTLKHFDLVNHRNMYLHNARASTDMTLWTCIYTYVRGRTENCLKQKTYMYILVSKDRIILMNTYMKSAIAVWNVKKSIGLPWFEPTPTPQKLPRLLWLE